MCGFTDAEWVRLLKQEPRAAEAEKCLWEDIYKYCWYELRKKGFDDGELIEDCAVDVFERTVNNVTTFRFESSFRTWWRVIASKRILTLIQRELRRRRREQPLPDSEDLDFSTSDTFTAVTAEQRVVLQRLQPCLEQLGKRQRQVIELRFLTPNGEGRLVEQSVDAVAAQLQITNGAVATASHNACANLRKCLEANGYFEPDDIFLF